MIVLKLIIYYGIISNSMSIKVTEILPSRLDPRGLCDGVDLDGDVVSIDLSGEDLDVTYGGGDFAKRNEAIRKMCNLAGKVRKLSGLAEYRRSCGDYGRARIAEEARRRAVVELAQTAGLACQLCPFNFNCGLSGGLGAAILGDEIDYRELRRETSLTKVGNPRSGWDKKCSG